MFDAYSMYSSKFVCMIIKIDKALIKTKFEWTYWSLVIIYLEWSLLRYYTLLSINYQAPISESNLKFLGL